MNPPAKPSILDHLNIYTDGGARGNPGPAAIGFVVTDASQNILFQHGQTIGTATNNTAEYQALIEALSWVKANCHPAPRSITCYLDSNLVVNQLLGRGDAS